MKTGTSVIIAAAGSGSRMKSTIPKQFMEIEGKPLLWYTLKTFNRHPKIDEIIIVGPKVYQKEIHTIAEEFSKVTHIVEGGEKRQDSVMNGFNKVNDTSDNILVHDGVRAFVDEDTISRVIEGLDQHDCIVSAIRVTSTIKRVDDNNRVVETIDREQLRDVQTPQGMKRDIFEKSYAKAQSDGFYGTDEAMIAEYNNISVFVVEGSKANIKVTTPEDFDYGHFLANKMQQL